jgi:hypothetical protein
MDDLRYPIGPFTTTTPFTAAHRAVAITTLADLPARLRRACQGLVQTQLDTPYRPGGWSVRQVVHHLAYSHINAYLRTKFALSEDNPTVKPYPEQVWAEMTDGKTAPVTMSLDLVDGLHGRWALWLGSFETDQFSRTLFHPDNGLMTLDEVLDLYAWHSRHHTAHVTALRARQGW